MLSTYHHRRQRGQNHAGEWNNNDDDDQTSPPETYAIQPKHIQRIADTAKHAIKENT